MKENTPSGSTISNEMNPNKEVSHSMFKVGIIGPTNIPKLSELTNKPIEFFLEKARTIGGILAQSNCELWINGDQGMLVATGRAYKDSGGKKLTVLYPEKGDPWPKEHALPYVKNADELRKEPDWFRSNYNVTALPDICICVGLSAGTLSELAYIKWNYQFKRGNLKKLVAIKELLRGESLPPEIEVDIKEIVQYLDRSEDLRDYLAKFRK